LILLKLRKTVLERFDINSMSLSLSMILPYVLLATGVGILGGVIAAFWNPKARARSAIQHFAAGAVLAAVASNVIPEAERLGSPFGILGGLVAGGLLMIGLKSLVVRFERQEKHKHQPPLGLAVASALDTLLDGVIISAGFSADQQLGTLLVIALAIELFCLTLAVGGEFHKGKVKLWQQLAVTSAIACLLLVGALVGQVIFGGASPSTVAVVLAFGSAALIYLIAEELLVETIQAEESIFSTAMLFGGFLVLLALKLWAPGSD
jgi:ZIP family zinc transporter